jgi:O-antigen ligase
LTTVNPEIVQAAPAGERLALWLGLLTICAAVAAAAQPSILNRLLGTRRRTHVYVAAVIGTTAVLLLLIFGRFGAPWTIASNAYDSFTSPPPRVQNLNERIFSFSGSYRADIWASAWDQFAEHPVTGAGAGSFEQYWLEHRTFAGKVRDAHSLYLETLAELGPLGLALLLLALGVPVYAAFKARGHPLVPAAFGAYVAYLVHAGVDWDWEMPAVTLTALLIGASIVVAARKPEDEERVMSPRLRYGLLTGTLALAAVAFVGLVGNMALAQSADAARAGDWDQSESKARRAETWAPWSPEPWQRIGQAQLGRGELANARASFRTAIAHDERDWNLWLDLARASAGKAQLDALAQATKLNPLSPEIAQLRKELAELGTIEVEG